MEWGTIWSFNPMSFTGFAMFDWFFTVMILCGIAAWFAGLLFSVITRS